MKKTDMVVLDASGVRKAVLSFIKVAAVVLSLTVAAAVVFFEMPDKSLSSSVFRLAFSERPSSLDGLIGFILTDGDENEIVEPKHTRIQSGLTLAEVIAGFGEHINEAQNGNFPIVKANISNQGVDKTLILRNKTSKKFSDEYINGIIDADYPIEAKKSQDSPLVLIVHTHTTEAYAEEGKTSYRPDAAVAETRSRDDSKNVIAVGDVISDVLSGMGIGVIHCTEYHDTYVFSESYNRSYDTVEQYLKTYPSIKYVIDLHRDSVIRTNGEKVCAVCDVNGREAAQVMLVVGTNDNGLPHGKWETNFTLALKLQRRLVNAYGDLVRPVNIRSGRFNQQLSTGMLLLEVGTCGNTLEQAKYAARLVAVEYGHMILDNL